MFTSDLTPVTPVTTTSTVERVQRTDTECRARAREFLIHLIGAMPDDLTWDHTHRLQGHARLGGRQLVVIAPRDDASPHRRAHHARLGAGPARGRRTASFVARCVRHRRSRSPRRRARRRRTAGSGVVNPGVDSRYCHCGSLTVMTAATLHDARSNLVRGRVLDGVFEVLAAGEDLTFARVATRRGCP